MEGIITRIFENDDIIIYRREGQLYGLKRFFEYGKRSLQSTGTEFSCISQVNAYKNKLKK